MLSLIQKEELLKVALFAFRMQYGKDFVPADFNVSIDKPNYQSICSFILTSKRTNDNFRIKLYLTAFGNYTNVGAYQLMQFEDYTAGPLDEVYVSQCTLDKYIFASFLRYTQSVEFSNEMMSRDRIVLEDGTGFVKLESTDGLLVQEI